MSQYMTFKGNHLTKYWDVPKFQNLWQNLLKSTIIFKDLFPRNVSILPKSANAVMCPPGICSIALMLIHFQTAKDNKRESGFRWSRPHLGFSPYQSIYQFGMTKRGRVHVSARVDGKRVEESSGRSWSSVALVLLLAGIAGYINSAHVSRWGWYTYIISAIITLPDADFFLFQSLRKWSSLQPSLKPGERDDFSDRDGSLLLLFQSRFTFT